MDWNDYASLGTSLSVRPLPLLAIAVVAAAAGAAVFRLAHAPAPPPAAAAGTFLSQPRPLPEFALVDDEGRAFAAAHFRGRWSAVFVGFTRCPDVCPNALALLKNVHGQLAAQGQTLQVVFVSVDPARDPADTLKKYVD